MCVYNKSAFFFFTFLVCSALRCHAFAIRKENEKIRKLKICFASFKYVLSLPTTYYHSFSNLKYIQIFLYVNSISNLVCDR